MLECMKQGNSKKQLILLPSLGGYASLYNKLAHSLNKDTDIWGYTCPGHGNANCKPLKNITSVIEYSLPLFANKIQPNCIFLGHSMGGIIAYFLVQRILSDFNYPIKPKALILSACSPPSAFSAVNYSKLSDKDLIDLIISYQGIPEELIRETNFLKFLIPIFRADFEVLESSANIETRQVNIPVYFLWGEVDKIAPIEVVPKWSCYFTQDIKLIPIANGSHFFIQDQVEYTANIIEKIFIEIVGVGRVARPCYQGPAL